jgi:NAD(P)-dependent dehydrogenase (short-subunit alcohol dehydrogenase family)
MSSDNNNIDLSGQTALVTGGSRGLGRAFAQALAKAGAAVAVAARSEGELAETVGLIEAEGGRALAITADVTDQAAVERMVETAEQQLGPIDLLVNNAGDAQPLGAIWEVDADRWWQTIDLNVRGPFLCSRAVLKGMVSRRSGRIINLSSTAANIQTPKQTAYGVSKAALANFSNSLAAETEEYGIVVLAYHPGPVRTALTELVVETVDIPEEQRAERRKNLRESGDEPLNNAVPRFMLLAAGKADSLSGRHISIFDDLDDMLSRAEEIQKEDLYALRLRT